MWVLLWRNREGGRFLLRRLSIDGLCVFVCIGVWVFGRGLWFWFMGAAYCVRRRRICDISYRLRCMAYWFIQVGVLGGSGGGG